MDWYRWFPTKFREKTLELDPYQDGCYRRLIDEYMHTRKPLPSNDAALARICGISKDEWIDHACSMLVAFFKQKNGLLFNKTCDEELDFQDKQSKFFHERAKKAAEIRHIKNNGLDATSMPQALLDHARDKNREIRDKKVSKKDSPLPPNQQDDAVNLFNELAEKIGLPKIQKLSTERKRRLSERLKDAGGIDGWKEALGKLEKIPAMIGENDRGWKADFDFLIRESSFTKLMEGKYDNWGNRKTHSDRIKQQLQEWVDGR